MYFSLFVPLNTTKFLKFPFWFICSVFEYVSLCSSSDPPHGCFLTVFFFFSFRYFNSFPNMCFDGIFLCLSYLSFSEIFKSMDFSLFYLFHFFYLFFIDFIYTYVRLFTVSCVFYALSYLFLLFSSMCASVFLIAPSSSSPMLYFISSNL